MWRRQSGSGADLLDDLRDLVDVPAVGRRPRAPLVAVDRPEVAVGVGPLVPDRDAAVLEPLDVGVAAQEPQQLGEHRPGVDLLGGDQREPLGEVEAHLVAEHADSVPVPVRSPFSTPSSRIRWRRSRYCLHGAEPTSPIRDTSPVMTVARRRRPRSCRRRGSTCTRPARPIDGALRGDVRRRQDRRRPATGPTPALRLPVTGSSAMPDRRGRTRGPRRRRRRPSRWARRRRCPCRASADQSGSSASTGVGVVAAAPPPSPGRCRSTPGRRRRRRVDPQRPDDRARGPPPTTGPERISGGAANASRSPRTQRDQAGAALLHDPPSDAGTPPASSQACARADRRVAGERQLARPA